MLCEAGGDHGERSSRRSLTRDSGWCDLDRGNRERCPGLFAGTENTGSGVAGSRLGTLDHSVRIHPSPLGPTGQPTTTPRPTGHIWRDRLPKRNEKPYRWGFTVSTRDTEPWSQRLQAHAAVRDTPIALAQQPLIATTAT